MKRWHCKNTVKRCVLCIISLLCALVFGQVWAMKNEEIRQSVEESMDLFDDSTLGIQEAIQYTADRLGLTVARVEKAMGWR